MAIFDKIASLFGGGLVDSMLDTVKAYFPPGMTPQQEAELKLELERLAFEKQKQADAMLAMILACMCPANRRHGPLFMSGTAGVYAVAVVLLLGFFPFGRALI